MANFDGLYDVRDGNEEDVAFIFSTMLRGLYYGDSWFSLIPKDIFMDNYKVFVGNLLRSPKVIVKVACLKDEPDVIIGYSVLSSDYSTVHWVYVKSAWRLGGIARSLLPKYPIAVTHLTKIGKQLMIEKFNSTVFNPFAIN